MEQLNISKNEIKLLIKEAIRRFLGKDNGEFNDELIEYMWLRPSKTGIPVDIFVDDGGAYKRNGHPLLLLARNGYTRADADFIPFVVSKHPVIYFHKSHYNISYNEIFQIQEFITSHLSLLRQLANNKISQVDFFNAIREKKELFLENVQIIEEMSTLKAKDSHLPMDIWVDEGETFLGHAPRIKFRASKEQRTTREFSSMLITDPTVIKNFPPNSPLSKKDIQCLQNFVINNQSLLLRLAHGEIDYETEFLPKMITGGTTIQNKTVLDKK